MSKNHVITATMAGATLLLAVAAWRTDAQRGDPPSQTSTILGQALPGLTEEQQQAFSEGLQKFSTVETREEGLGPVFNGTTCAECHKAGAIGGAGIDLTISRVTRIGGIRNGVYSDLTDFGGPVLQARSLKEFDTSCPIDGENIPRQSNRANIFASLRITTPLFGVGLIEAIPAETILARTRQNDPDGVQGVANIQMNPETGKKEVGRFGWKSQHSSLHRFSGDAYLNEMGITSQFFPDDNLPQGKPIPPGWETVPDDDIDEDVEAFTTFMRLLAPPGRLLPLTPQVQEGERLFQQIRCTSCHIPEMKTGANPIAALSKQSVPLYSDLLVHRMGRNLADGIQQGLAQGDQFRTAPLWGASRRRFFLHDGRANNVEEAILHHGGEATASRDRFTRLQERDKAALRAFIHSL
ncbi:MAG: hypothetical protein NT023_20785 [Armatimonadetes bacterium]|nr:hypothetical protein [Armatimonadota bacterium]